MLNQKNMVRKNSYFNVCKNIIASDLVILKKKFLTLFIDKAIWFILTAFVTCYIMPYFGLSSTLGMFVLGGMLPAVGLFQLYPSVVELVADLQGDRVIDYNLTLPIPSWLAILSKVGYYFLAYFPHAVLILPLSKFVLWNQVDLLQINYLKLVLALIFQNIFYACFTIFAGSLIDDMSQLGTIWSRCIFPMWFMGGFQFSWIALYSVTPIIAWVNLFNPMIYITESTRVALLGQADYLNFWMCLAMIALFSIFSFTAGLWNLKKRLDFVV